MHPGNPVALETLQKPGSTIQVSEKRLLVPSGIRPHTPSDSPLSAHRVMWSKTSIAQSTHTASNDRRRHSGVESFDSCRFLVSNPAHG
jgi:hypothetical protein